MVAGYRVCRATPLDDSPISTIIGESGVAGQMFAPLALLSKALSNASDSHQLPQTQGWVSESTISILQKAAVRLTSGSTPMK